MNASSAIVPTAHVLEFMLRFGLNALREKRVFKVRCYGELRDWHQQVIICCYLIKY